ncbi:MAG: ABC transporter transmembrane domain-containing protein, partial [Planctomycetota bacterium]|nr:ABC transporter transmembrane domain-containing protein [Planctomycetota bacterium]
MSIAESKEQSLAPEDNEHCFQILEPLARALKPSLTPTEIRKAIQWGREKALKLPDLVSISIEKLGLALLNEAGTLDDLIGAAALSPSLIVSYSKPLLLLECKGNKVLVLSSDRDAEWVETTKLAQSLGLEDADKRISWLRVQNLTPLQNKEDPDQRSYFSRLLQLVAMERRDLRIVFVFALAIGLLNLATPIAVEALVNTVAFGGLLQPVIILSLMLMTCLGLSAALSAFQAYIVEILQRRLFVRLSCELGERLPQVPNESFDTKYGPELVNRFFDVLTVQKVGAKFLLDTVTVILSASLGLLILAFYHPILLAFDFALILILLFIVAVLGRGSMKTSIKESSAKYAVAEWLEELARHHTTFKGSARQLARDQIDNLTRNYLEKRAGHFRIVFRQLLSSLT